MTNSKVYITQENSSLNYLPAEQFGEIVFLTRNDFSQVKGSITNGILINELRTKLREFDPENDYIAVSGSPVVAGVAFMILRERTDKVNILRWSNRDRVYQTLSIQL